MQVYCENCRQVVGKVPDENIPADKSVKVKCPKCADVIALNKPTAEEIQPISSVGAEQATQPDGTPPVAVAPSDATHDPVAAPPSKSQNYKLQFSGTAGEYFRIWIVNTFLSIITLGIYAAWAKVRTRRYFYAHTKLDGHSFDYLADPMAILKGNLIVGIGLILYSSARFVDPLFTIAAVLVFFGVFPLLVFKSLRFYAHNSAYRNIRFRFFGDLKESYETYMLIPLTIPFTMGLSIPYWEYRRKNYFFNNFGFGSSTNSFTGQPKIFYKYYLIAYAFIIGFVFLMSVGIGVSMFSFFQKAAPSAESADFQVIAVLSFVVGYIGMLLFFTFIQQYIYTRLTNYCWHESRMGSLRFKSTIQARKLLWIRLSNIFAIIASLGMLAPWAKIRRTRYILDNLELITEKGLDQFTAATEEEVSAYGDSATDFFDFEIGL